MLPADNHPWRIAARRARTRFFVGLACLLAIASAAPAVADGSPESTRADHALGARSLDVRLFRAINLKPERRDALDPFFLGIMPLGSRAAGAISLGLYGIGKAQGDSHMCDAGVLTGAAMVTSALISEGVKGAVSRRRPLEELGAARVRVVGEPAADSRSFPSGHTATAFAWATVLAELYPDRAWLFYGTASAVGVGRVRVGAHYPSDVLAGALIGFASGRLAVSNWELIRRGGGPAQGSTTVGLSRSFHF